MAIGKTNAGGAGGAALNFKVIGGTSQPSNPTENTIWINTSTAITGYYFQVEQPVNMQQGEIWISTGTDSQIAFNALMKNSIKVYPISAKQYVSGSLTDMTAVIYQGGKWASWLTYLYKEGDECTDVTGGWQGRAWDSVAGDGHYADAFVLTRYETYMHCSLGQNRTGVVEIKKDISFKGKKKLNLECSNVLNNNTNIGLRMAIINRNASYWFTDASSIVSIGDGINYITLENYQNDNTYDVIICAVTNEGSAEASFDMLNSWLE